MSTMAPPVRTGPFLYPAPVPHRSGFKRRSRTMDRLSGIWLPLITPFIDGEVDDSSLRRLVAHYMKQPIDGFIVAATTGEGLVLDDGETRHVVDTVVDGVAWHRPVFLGLCGSDTRRLATR